MGNIVNDYIKDFIIENMNLELSNELKDIEKYAIDNYVPIIDKEVQNFIKMFLDITKPKKILEFGTAIGFSAIFMYEQLKGNVHITTMERDEERIKIAKNNFKLYGCEENINLIEGDCFENIDKISDTFDLIFVDSSKSHYKNLFDKSIHKLNENGIIIFDNILYKGMIASDDLVQKRKKTIVKNMRFFIQDIVNKKEFFTLLLPIGDGVMILRRKN